MADEQPVAAAPAVESTEAAPAAAEGQGKGAGKKGGAAAAGAAPSEPIKILEKPVEVKEPSEADKQKAIDACKARMAAIDKRLADIKATIDRSVEDRKAQGDSSGTLRSELKPLRERFNNLKERRQTLFNEMVKQQEARKAAQTKLKEMQKTLKVGSLEEIDRQIAAIEFEMSTSTLSLKDEKAKMLDIKTLRASRDQVKQVQTMSASVSTLVADQDSIKTLQEEVKDLDQQMNVIRAREKEITTELDAIREKHTQAAPKENVGELIKERKALQANWKEQRDQIRVIEDKYRGEFGQWKKYQREFREWKRQQDQIKYQERVKEREERKKEREKEDDDSNFKEVPSHPWADEIFTCDDLIKFCKKHVTKKESTSTKKTFDPSAGAEKGLIPMGKKTVKDEDIEFAGARKGKKGGDDSGAAAAAAGGEAAVVDKKIKLSIDAYTGFLKVGVEPPTLASQCANAAQQLQQAKARFQRMTEADKKKAKDAASAAAAKAKEEAKKVAKARTSTSDSAAAGIPAAEVAEPTIDFRKAIRGVKGAHV